MTNLQELISDLEQQKAAIENALAALRQVSGATEPKRRGRPPASDAGPRKRGRPPGSATGHRRRGRPPGSGAAQPTPTAPAKRQVTFTEEGRQRLAEAMKKRWAVKRAAKRAANRVAAKQSAVKKTAAKKTVAKRTLAKKAVAKKAATKVGTSEGAASSE